MWKFIKEPPAATRGQKALSAVALIIVIDGMLTVGGNVFRHLRNADLRVNPPHFDEGRIDDGVVGDRYLSVTMGYSNPQSKFELLRAWRGSVFHPAQ